MSDSVRIREVSSVVAQRIVNRRGLRNQVFHALTPQQHKKDVKTVHEGLSESH